MDTPGGMTAWLQKSNNGNETKDINEDVKKTPLFIHYFLVMRETMQYKLCSTKIG